MSSNIPFSTANPYRHEDDNDYDDQHDHDVLSQRIRSSDYVGVEIPHASGAVPSQLSRAPMSTSLRVRATPPNSQAAPPAAPGSMVHSLSTAMASSSGGGAGPADHPGGASAKEDRQQQTPLPFSGVCKPAPWYAHRSHRQHAGVECRHCHRYWWWCALGAGDGSDNDAGKQ
jgi:hypothetical protein